MRELDQHIKKLIKNKTKGSFAEFHNGDLIVGLIVSGNELEIQGVKRIDVVDVINGLACYIVEQSDGTIVDIPPTYSMISFQLFDPDKERKA